MRKHILFPLCWLLFLINIAAVFSQSIESLDQSDIQVQKFDIRSKGIETAVRSAMQSSQKNIIVVMCHGASSELIEQTEGDLLGLARNGYPRTALVLAPKFEDQKSNAVLSIFANGKTYALIKDAKVGALTSSDLYQLVRDAYKEYISTEGQ